MPAPEPVIFTFRNPAKDRLAKRIGEAVRRHDFYKSETRWRRVSFTLAIGYLLYLVAVTKAPMLRAIGVVGIAICFYGAVAPKLGRFAPMPGERQKRP